MPRLSCGLVLLCGSDSQLRKDSVSSSYNVVSNVLIIHLQGWIHFEKTLMSSKVEVFAMKWGGKVKLFCLDVVVIFRLRRG